MNMNNVEAPNFLCKGTLKRPRKAARTRFFDPEISHLDTIAKQRGVERYIQVLWAIDIRRHDGDLVPLASLLAGQADRGVDGSTVAPGRRISRHDVKDFHSALSVISSRSNFLKK